MPTITTHEFEKLDFYLTNNYLVRIEGLYSYD